jgi:tetratricopeptide (TPR) repeat protein
MFGFRARRLFWRACRLEDRGDIEGARRIFERVLESGAPYAATSGLMLGRMLLKVGELDRALAAFERTLACRRPADAGPPERENVSFKAAVGLEVVFELREDHEGAARARALSYELAQDQARARGASRIEPAAVEVDRGHDFEFYGHVSSARRAFEAAEAAGHSYWSAHAAFSLGKLLSRQGDLDGALAAFESVIIYDNPHFTDSARARIQRLRVRESEI